MSWKEFSQKVIELGLNEGCTMATWRFIWTNRNTTNLSGWVVK